MALIHSADQVGYEFKILDAVTEVNENQKHSLVPKILKHYKGSVKGKKFALWGLAFKPDTDDIREAPAFYLIDDLIKEGASIVAFDPEAMPNSKNVLGNKIEFAPNEYQALEGADGLIIATEWSLFRTPEFKKLKEKLKDNVIFDGRNLYEIGQMQEWGFTYYSVGRKVIL